MLWGKARLGILWWSVLLLLLTACNFRFVPTATPQPTATPLSPPRLSVSYLENGTVYFWREGDTAPHTLASNASPPIALSPNGLHVAFTRGQDGQPQTLWVVNTADNRETALVELGDIPAQRSARAMIGDVRWLDDATLYFNSYQAYEWGFQQDNNLYRVALGTASQPTSDPILILPPGAGGAFSFSPDRRHIAAAYPGQYDTENGRILILDPLGNNVNTALEFQAVSTASEVPFYPPMSWSPDSSAVRVPIPDRDLVYDPAIAPPVELWHLPAEGEARILGYMPAAFNGLPRWSPYTGTMLYAQPSTALDMYNLYLADADGVNAQQYADGSAEILNAHWLDDEPQFVFGRGTSLMLGERGQPPQPIVGSVQHWRIAGRYAIYTTAADLRYANIDDSGSSALIAAPAPAVFDAVFAP
jgi:Tol biopolymer transport system component